MMILENPGARLLAGTAQTADDAITVEDLSKHYGHFGAVKNVSLSIHRGEVFGLLGPNGAGKTTLIECIVGLRSPSAGQIKVLGMNPRAERRAFTSRVAVQPQEASLFDSLRVAEALKLFASMHDNPFPIPDVLAQIGLAEFSRSLVRKLSGGQRRRLLLGVAMIGRPEVIVLDEPSAGLDPQARRNLWDVIRGLRDGGTTVLVTTHHMDEATELCDVVAIMVDGEIAAQGSPHELVARLAEAHTVAFTMAGDSSAAAQTLSALEGVSNVQVGTASPDGAVVKVQTTVPDAVLTAATHRTEWVARNFTIESGDLENVFLALAGTADPASRTTRGRTRKETLQ